MSFVIGTYQAVERPGAGHHAAPVGLWRGEDLRTVDDVAMTVLPVECLETVRSGVAQVESLRHPHLLPVTDVVFDDDRVAVISPWPRGGRLSELVARRGSLAPSEALTVLLPVAGALAAVHATGIRHCGVSPESVWFDANGRPLLGATAVGRIVAELNGGMPAVCRDVAPEVARGDAAEGAASAAADVFSLGSVALFCLTGRSAWPADDPLDVLVQSAAGLWPDPPDDAGPALLIALIRAMLSDEPADRPSAAAVVEELSVIGAPAAIAFGSGPAPASTSADRWRGWNSNPSGQMAGNLSDGMAQAQDDDDATRSSEETIRTDSQGSHDGANSAGHRLRSRFRSDPAARAELLGRAPAVPVETAGPTGPTPLAKVGIALLTGLLITLAMAQVFAWSTGRDDPATSSLVGPSAAPHDWSAVVVELDKARGVALERADPGMLDDVYTDDAQERSTDAATIAQLAALGWHVADAVHEIGEVTALEPPSGSSHDDQLRLAVVDLLPARAILDQTGQQVGMTAARTEQRRIFLIRPTGAGYRISDIQPG
ncbi:MAG: protein kinase [Nakamurella sp.]